MLREGGRGGACRWSRPLGGRAWRVGARLLRLRAIFHWALRTRSPWSVEQVRWVDAQSAQEGLWSLSMPWGSSSWRIFVVVVGTRLLSLTRRVALHPTTNKLTDSTPDRVWHKSLGIAFYKLVDVIRQYCTVLPPIRLSIQGIEFDISIHLFALSSPLPRSCSAASVGAAGDWGRPGVRGRDCHCSLSSCVLQWLILFARFSIRYAVFLFNEFSFLLFTCYKTRCLIVDMMLV